MVSKTYVLDVTGDPVMWNLPASAGDMGSIPGPGRFQCVGAPLHHSWACAQQQEEPPHWEARTSLLEWPCSAQLETAQRWRPSTARNRNNNSNNKNKEFFQIKCFKK